MNVVRATLQCLGDFKNLEHQFLDGNTSTGIVGLAPNTQEPFTGTMWEITGPLENGFFTFRCLGHIQNPDHRFLDGRTQDGLVSLVHTTEEPFTGTMWEQIEISSGVFILKCQGHIHNQEHQFLDGRTQDGFVSLAPTTGEPFTGTRWSIKAFPF
ncbi:hypothetical protein KSF_088170 [Reticulibacter mediterranei]|uniref:Uncharacterized protein n=1 Tax=Reticulibacter mediterranei TaxID=2778369 RepID=A0A8J3N566_9CHLR|nr:hypothetical protein [Reticulibacter mediterranei]GHO98769.1 hypothetical protein KSF_088170 [Reticulibacter mediterranei]